jgi:hypothetical protein
MSRQFEGIGYQEYKDMRVINEGIDSGALEDAGNERFLIYFGRLHLEDHETGIKCRGPLKIGRGKYATALMRGRNQPGGDFRIYGEIIVSENYETDIAEKIIKSRLRDRNIIMSQGQQEIYDIEDSELEDIIKEMSEIISKRCNIIEVKIYKEGNAIDLTFSKSVSILNSLFDFN